MKCIDEEIPFEIPECWEWVRLADVCSIITDGTHQTPTYSDDGYIFLSSKNVTTGKIDWENVMYIPESLHEQLYARLAPQKGDILLAKNGTTGFSAVVDRDCVFDIYVSLALLRTFQNEINPYYLRHIMSSSFVQEQFKANLKGIGVPNLHLENIRNTYVPICSLKEQSRIIAMIDSVTTYIDEIEQCKGELVSAIILAKQKILSLAIQGKLVPQDPNDEPASVLLERIKAEHPKSKKKSSKTSDNSHYAFSLPESWTWTTIGEISQHNTGKTLDKGRNSGTLHKYITTSNLYWDSFVLDSLKEMPFEENELDKCSAIKGDLLICEGGDGGRSAIWNKEYPICFQNHIHRVRPFSGIRSKYIYFFMLYSSLNGYINYYKKGIGIQSLSGNSLSSIRLPLPSIPEQKRIVKKIEEIFASLDEITNSIKA